MGILNVTPDSFSDGGRFTGLESAVEHAGRLTASGADIVDVGGESTRPGAVPVPTDVELRRVLPVVRALVETGVKVSIDTQKAVVARAALEAGAGIINDVTGGADPEMKSAVAAAGVPVVIAHSRGPSALPGEYSDVSRDVVQDLAARARAFEHAGVEPSSIILDPGLGFSKTPQQNWELLRHLNALQSLGYPVLIGASRKRFLRTFVDTPEPASPELDEVSAMLTAVVLSRFELWGVRTHVPRLARVAQRLVDALDSFEGTAR
ncbi:dihydropteroate synthase [Herbiconiux sp. A18JL235]|uniref:dihydropteroate synthase n=1 Tax=Herbiconiux sp. A18JL235 TaxID=3152363 RepID=A0AB39BJ51_9MICO